MDKKNVLELEDDAAHVNWGGDWRMPTYYELRELLMNCSWVWCSNYNNSYSTGYKVTSKINGQFIFLPAAGIISYDGLIQARKSGTYWTSTLNQIDDYAAMALDFSQGYINSELNTNSRPLGMSVRPVLSRK